MKYMLEFSVCKNCYKWVSRTTHQRLTETKQLVSTNPYTTIKQAKHANLEEPVIS